METNDFVQNRQKIITDAEKYKPKDGKKQISNETKQNYLFVSFDICNSTELKKRSKYWFDIIRTFLTSNDFLTSMRCWKLNGDEILYIAEISSIKEIIETLEEIEDCLYRLKERLIDTIKGLVKDKNNSDIKFELLNINIKGAIWIAQTDFNGFRDKSILNYKFKLNNTIDFSGINVDEGFRLRVWASKQKVVVDPKIVALLYIAYGILDENLNNNYIKELIDNDFDEIKSKVTEDIKKDYTKKIRTVLMNFKLLGYEHCKGIWNDRLYPIICYSKDWDKLSKTIEYDEKFDGKYVRDIINEHIEESKEKETQFEKINNLISVLSQVDEIDTVKKIADKIKFEPIPGTESTETRILNSKANLYYMVVCVNPKTNRVLIFQRSENRKHLKKVWDFGNVKHLTVESKPMKEIIVDEYNKMFDLEIEVITDSSRNNDFVKPYALCTVPRYGVHHNGILCYAKILNNLTEEEILEKVKNKLNTTKQDYKEVYRYNDAMFIDETIFDELKFHEMTFDEIKEDSLLAGFNAAMPAESNYVCIDNFKVSIKDAIKEIKRLENNA